MRSLRKSRSPKSADREKRRPEGLDALFWNQLSIPRLDYVLATRAVMTAVKIPAAKVLAPDNNIFSFDIRPRNIPRLNITLIMRITEMIPALAGIRLANAKKKGSIEITAAMNGETASTRAVQTEAKRDAFPSIVLPRSVNIALFNLSSRLFLSALSAIHAPEEPEIPIAKLAQPDAYYHSWIDCA